MAEDAEQLSPISRMRAPLGGFGGRKPAPAPEPEPPCFAAIGTQGDGEAAPAPPQPVGQMLRGAFDPLAFATDTDSNGSSGSDGGGSEMSPNVSPVRAGDDAAPELEEGQPPSLRVEDVSPRREERSWSSASSASPVQKTIDRAADPRNLSPSELTHMFKAAYGRPEATATSPASAARPVRPVAKRVAPAASVTLTEPSSTKPTETMSPTSRLFAPISASPSRTQADVEFRRGKQASGKAEWMQAVEAYERYRELATPQHSRYVQALADLGGCYAQLQKFSQAEDTIHECIQHLGGADGSMTPKEEQMLGTVKLTLSIVRSRQQLSASGREAASWSFNSDFNSPIRAAVDSPQVHADRVALPHREVRLPGRQPSPTPASPIPEPEVTLQQMQPLDGEYLAAATIIGRMAEQATSLPASHPTARKPFGGQPASPTMNDLERIQTTLLEQVNKVESKVERLQLQEVDLIRRALDSPMQADIDRLETELRGERERAQISEQEMVVAAEVAAEAVAFSASALAAATAKENEAVMQLPWTQDERDDIADILARWRESKGNADIADGVLATTSLRYLGLMARYSMNQAKQHLVAQHWEIACKQLQDSAELGRFFQSQRNRAQRALYTWLLAVRGQDDADVVPVTQLQKAEEEMARLNGLISDLLVQTDRGTAHVQDLRQEHVMLLSEHADLRDQNVMLKMGKQKAVLDTKATVNHVLLSRVFNSWFKIVALRKATYLGRTAATQAYAIEAAQDSQAQTIAQFRRAMEEVQSRMKPIVNERDAALALAEEESSRAADAEANAEQTSMILEEAEQKLQAMGVQVRAAHEQLRLLELEHKVVPMQELEAIRADLARLEESYQTATERGVKEATERGEARMREVQAGADAAVKSLRRALADAQSNAVNSSTAFYENEIHDLQARLERECRERAVSERAHAASQAAWEARTLRAEQELENERSGRREAEASSARLAAASAGLIPSQKNLEQEVERLATTVERTQSGHDAVKKELSSADVRCHELTLRLEAEVRARTATEAILEDTKKNLDRRQANLENTTNQLASVQVRCHELELRLEAEARARTANQETLEQRVEAEVRARKATEASLEEMTRMKQLVEDKIVGATLRLERETLLRMEEKATHEKISKALTDQLTQLTTESRAELERVKAETEARVDELTVAAAQLMREQETLEEVSITTVMQLEGERDAHAHAQEELSRLKHEAELSSQTHADLETALAKYDHDLATELTFRSKAERSLSLAVDRMNQRRNEEVVASTFYSWARRTASKAWIRKRQVRVVVLANEHVQARAFAAWLGATEWKTRADHLMSRAIARMSVSITRKSLDAWVEATAATSQRSHSVARAARLFTRRLGSKAFVQWADLTADTYRLVHIATKVVATLRSNRLQRIVTEWRAWSTYERNARSEAEILKLRGEHTVQTAARAAAEARAAKAEAAIEREKAARTRRVELRREARAAMVVQRWYRRWLAEKLASDDELYAFLRADFNTARHESVSGAEGLLEYEPRLRAESVDLHTLKELEVDDLKHFGIPVGPARRIFNVLRRHREDDLSVVVRSMKTQGEQALDWMKHRIHVDDKATVRPPTAQPKASELELRPHARHDWLDKSEHPGVVRYIGRIAKRKGLYVGLELLDFSEGLVTGEFDGVRYFSCDKGGHAVFVRPKSLLLQHDARVKGGKGWSR